MTDNRKAGLALILGSVGGMITMGMHFIESQPRFALVAGLAHALALVSVAALFLGGLGLARSLWDERRLALAGVVAYGMAVFAAVVAGSISGFVIPNVLSKMQSDVSEAQANWRIAIACVWQINQAMSKVYSVAAAGAMLLWSVASLQTRRLSRGSAIYGCVAAPLITLLIAVGHLRVDRHGMTVIMLTEAIWFVGMGVSLLRAKE
jgi:hypothetical protein